MHKVYHYQDRFGREAECLSESFWWIRRGSVANMAIWLPNRRAGCILMTRPFRSGLSGIADAVPSKPFNERVMYV